MSLALYEVLKPVPPKAGEKPAPTQREIHESPLNDPPTVTSRRFFTRTEDPEVYVFKAAADADLQLLVTSRAGDTREL